MDEATIKNIPDLAIDSVSTAERIVQFLKKEFSSRKKNRAILALSGGIDSTVAAYLCKMAGLDLYGIVLPYGEKGDEGIKVAEALNLTQDHIININIAPVVNSAAETLEGAIELDEMGKGNIMARERMVFQYAIAKALGGLVIGTENLSEYYLGYFTLFGDQACDISPISSLWKTQVYQLGEYLGVPEWVLKKAPTAGLWEGQTDESEFGFTYKDADQILHLTFNLREPKEKIITDYGFVPDLVDKVLHRVAVTEFKRMEAPKC